MTENTSTTNATLFDDNANPSTPEVPEGASALDILVGEGKKFKTVEDLARGKLAADTHIQQLEAENAQARNELKTRLTLEEFLDKMNTPKEPEPKPEQLNPNPGQEAGLEKAALTTEQLEALVSNRINAERQKEAESRNLRDVQSHLVSAFGPNYTPKLREIASQLGVTEEYLNQTAAKTPSVFLRLVGIGDSNSGKVQPPLTPPATSFNSSTIPSNSGEKTKSYYDQIRKTDPKRYRSLQVEMHNQALKLGPAFFK